MPLLAVHGSGCGHDQGIAFASPLARQGIRVIAMSRFGYLRTPTPADASVAAQADAHVCLLDALGFGRPLSWAALQVLHRRYRWPSGTLIGSLRWICWFR